MSEAFIGDIPIAAVGTVGWSLTAGIAPYSAQYTVHRKQWEAVQEMIGDPQTLKIKGLNGEITVNDVYVLHDMTTNSPNRVGIMVTDKRWLWPYKLVVRDYNVTRKTGNRMILQGGEIPIELVQFVDRFKYMSYSLDGEQKRWTGQRAIEDVLTVLEGAGNFDVSGISLGQNEGTEGAISIQNLLLRDAGHLAMSRVLSTVPGTDVTVDLDGTVRVFDATDLGRTEEIRDEMTPITQLAEYPRKIDRKAIRPKKIRVYTVREVEIRLDINENLGEGATVVRPGEDDPFCENVLPLPDPVTFNIPLRDEYGNLQVIDAPQGMWAPVTTALRKWEEERLGDPAAGAGGKKQQPFTFKTIENGYITGKLPLWWGNPELDRDLSSNAQGRASAFTENWRKTFRINPKYMQRIREIRAVRVALLDPITGARAPSMAWLNYCIIPSKKGIQLQALTVPDWGPYMNVLGYPGYEADLSDKAPSQFSVSVIDGKLGIFRINHILNPYGTTEAAVPMNLVAKRPEDSDSLIKYTSMRRAISAQDDHPIAPGMIVGQAPGITTSPEFDMAVILSFVPNCPNDKTQMHVEEYTSEEIAQEFQNLQGLAGGEGPDAEIFIPPSVCTARFGWLNDAEARQTIRDIMGTVAEGDAPGLSAERVNMPGFIFVNGEDEIPANSKAAAAELLMSFADTLDGDVQTKTNPDAKVEGSVSSVSHVLEPGGRFMQTTDFRGRQISVDRYALLPNSVRHITLGIIPYKSDVTP